MNKNPGHEAGQCYKNKPDGPDATIERLPLKGDEGVEALSPFRSFDLIGAQQAYPKHKWENEEGSRQDVLDDAYWRHDAKLGADGLHVKKWLLRK